MPAVKNSRRSVSPQQLRFSWMETEKTGNSKTSKKSGSVASRLVADPTIPAKVAANASPTPPRVLPVTNGPYTRPTATLNSSPRIGRESPISELMVAVLARYGITEDEIRAELEGCQK